MLYASLVVFAVASAISHLTAVVDLAHGCSNCMKCHVQWLTVLICQSECARLLAVVRQGQDEACLSSPVQLKVTRCS